MVKIMENPMEIHDLGGTTLFGNTNLEELKNKSESETVFFFGTAL